MFTTEPGSHVTMFTVDSKSARTRSLRPAVLFATVAALASAAIPSLAAVQVPGLAKLSCHVVPVGAVHGGETR